MLVTKRSKRTTRRVRPSISNKFIYYSLSSTFSSITSTPITRELFDGIGTGFAQNTRSTNRIFIDFIRVTGNLVAGATNSVADDAYNTVRISLGLVLSSGYLLASAGLTQPVNNFTAEGLVKLGYDNIFRIGAVAKNSTGLIPEIRKVSFTVPVNAVLCYSATPHPNLYVDLAMMSDSAAPPSPGFVSGFVEVHFHDL